MLEDYGFEYDDDIDVLLAEEDDIDYEYEDEGLAAAEYEDEDLAERRRRRRRPRRIRPGRAGRGRRLFRLRPKGNYVTQSQLQVSLTKVGSDISRNGAAIKRVAAQVNTNNRTLSAANARQDRELSGLRKDLKKQTDIMLLLTLLQKGPELETESKTITYYTPELIGTGTSGTSHELSVLTKAELKKEDNLLPLLLISGFGTGVLGSSTDSNTMLLLIIALSGKL